MGAENVSVFLQPMAKMLRPKNILEIGAGYTADILCAKYGAFDFLWFDFGGRIEYENVMDDYWNIRSSYIFFHYAYSDGIPNEIHDTILNNMTGSPTVFDIVEPHQRRQGSITMVRENDWAFFFIAENYGIKIGEKGKQVIKDLNDTE